MRLGRRPSSSIKRHGLPRAEIQVPLRKGRNDLMVQQQGLEVSGNVALEAALVLEVILGRCDLGEADLEILEQTWFVVYVDGAIRVQ